MGVGFWIELLGWMGSATLIVGLLQRQMVPLRLVSICAAVLLVAYNALIGSWSMVAMNVAILGINSYRLRTAVIDQQPRAGRLTARVGRGSRSWRSARAR